MMWLVADSLYCPEQFFASHLDSYAHYLREAGEVTWSVEVGPGLERRYKAFTPDVIFALDGYEALATWPARVRVAQVAARCSPMPWAVRRPDGSPAYDLVLSSIPAMVEEARRNGCRAEYMPLAFDTRARACGMGVKRERKAIFIGTVGPNHQRRARLLEELRDIVDVRPPVFGRAYFRELASAKVVLNVHAEWAEGAANNMRLFEAAGMGARVVSDGAVPPGLEDCWWWRFRDIGADDARRGIELALAVGGDDAERTVLTRHTYEARIPRLIELVQEVADVRR